jgi:hypothetical protein
MKTIEEMAREAGLEEMWELTPRFVERLKAFEALVRADEREQGQKWFDAVLEQHKIDVLAERSAGVKAEREACAKVCADLMDSPELIGDCHICIDAIRARGQA